MFEYDQRKVSQVAANITVRIMTAGSESSSPVAVPRPSQDGMKTPQDGPIPSMGCLKTHGPDSAQSNPTLTPSKYNRCRASTNNNSSNLLGNLCRMIRRGNRVAPIPLQSSGDPPSQGLAPAAGSPDHKANLPRSSPIATVTGDGCSLRPTTGRLHQGHGAPTGKRRWFFRPWRTTARSDEDSMTFDGGKIGLNEGQRISLSHQVAPVANNINQASAPLYSQGQTGQLPKSKAETDLSSLDTSSDDPRENIRPKRRQGRAYQAFPMLLGRLLGLLVGCFGKQNTASPLEESRTSTTKPGLPRIPHDEDRDLHGTTTAEPSEPTGKIVDCFPCSRTVRVAHQEPAPVFWIGSQDDSKLGTESTMGHVLSSESGAQQGSYKKLKTVANKQTSVREDDLQKAAIELQNEKQIKIPDHTHSEVDEESDEVEDIIQPTIDEKTLRQVSKEPGGPVILGRGQTGVVRLMRHRQPEGGTSLVAVKRLIGRSSRAQAAMMKEVRALQSVQHCFIFPRLLGVINKQSFAQEYIGNPRSLATLSITKALRGRPQISLLNWVVIIHDVITGLMELHQSGWAHCDLQTNNVLLWRDRNQSDQTEVVWEGRIIDLGNARMLEGPTRRCLDLSLSEKATYYRNCRHIAPEVVEGQEPYGIASDIYSLGVLIQDIASRVDTMYEMMPIADRCQASDHQQRPPLRALLKQLDAFCQEHTGYKMFPKEQNRIITYV